MRRETLEEVYKVTLAISIKSDLRKGQMRDYKKFLWYIDQIESEEKKNYYSVLEILVANDHIELNKWWRWTLFAAFSIIHVKLNDSFFVFHDSIEKQLKSNSDNIKTGLTFDHDKGILFIQEYEVKMSCQTDKTYAHLILSYIFNQDDIGQQFSYSEILEDVFNNEDDVTFRSCKRACDDIAEKVEKVTGIDDFIEYKTGKTGWVQIQKRYINNT